jgi:hypothetical protein
MMKRILTLLALLIGLSLSAFAQAQSKLPPCPKVDYLKNNHHGVNGRTGQWHNCFGRYVAELNDANKGDVYEGEFQNGIFQVQGTYTFANGDKYVGEFKDGFYSGQGTYYYLANNQFKGDKYVGEWKNSKQHGQGTYTYANGDKYVGDSKEGVSNGQGTYTHANGNIYVGDFKDGNRNGQGTFTRTNKTGFIGEWKDGKPNGKGIETYADGSPPKEGIWVEGKFVRSEKINLPPINN